MISQLDFYTWTRFRGLVSPGGWLTVASKPQAHWLQMEIKGALPSGCQLIIVCYLIVGTFPPCASQKNLNLVPEVKGGIGRRKGKSRRNMEGATVPLHWLLGVGMTVFGASQILKGAHFEYRSRETENYQNTFLSEMQITLSKIIKIATTFGKFRALRPCSSFAHFPPTNREKWHNERHGAFRLK